MGEAARVFVNLMATIFAANGLFPKDHPALSGNPDTKLTLGEVLTTAYRGLSYTKAGLPRVLLFYAVAGMIVSSILGLLTAFALFFIGTAHAQSCAGGSCFSVPSASATTDLAQNWLDFLFGTPTAQATAAANLQASGVTTLPSTTIQTALTAALSLYSYATLIFAAIILFYHLASMVVETAHSGVPMGKQSRQIWAPIRLVVAIGLLVPVSNGMNSGQFIVVQMAKWGSALASNVWSGFVTALASDPKAGALAPPTTAPDVSGIVSALMMMYGCEYAYNYQVSAVAATGFPSILTSQNINQWTFSPGGAPTPPQFPTALPNGASKYSFSNQLVSDYDLCGSYTKQPKPNYAASGSAVDTAVQAISDSLYNAADKAFETDANKAAAAVAGPLMQCFTDGVGTCGTLPTGMGSWTAIADNYQSDLAKALSAATSTGAGALASAMKNLATNSAASGWISAGAQFNALSAAQAEINGIMTNILPTVSPPKITAGDTDAENALHTSWFGNFISGGASGKQKDIYAYTQDALANFAKATGYITASGAAAAPGAAAATTVNTGASMTSGDCGIDHPTECIFGLITWIGERKGIWNPSTTSTGGVSLGVQFAGANPLAEMAAFGHRNIAAAMDMFDDALYLYGIASLNPLVAVLGGAALSTATGGASVVLAGLIVLLGKAAAILIGPLFFFGVMFLTLGSAIAYVVPLLPFIHFFFNTITWIACIAEGILGIPAVALAHLTPEGEGLPGQAAKRAYSMIFSILLRPVMMVFGLICGLLIMYVAAGLLNVLYGVAVGSQGGMAAGHVQLSRIMYSVIYVVILYSIANHAFALIGTFPNRAMEWMGANGLNGEKMGHPDHIGNYAAVATGYFGDRAANQIQNMTKNVGSAYQQHVAGQKNKEEKKNALVDTALRDSGGGTRRKPDGSKIADTDEGAYRLFSDQEGRIGNVMDLPSTGEQSANESRARVAGRTGLELPAELAGDERAVTAYHEERKIFDASETGKAGLGEIQAAALTKPDNAKTHFDELRQNRTPPRGKT